MHDVLSFLPSRLLENLGSNPSVAVVCTSNTKYLIFKNNSHFPLYVLQGGSELELVKLKNHIHELNALMPNQIAFPIGIVHTPKESLLIVDGLPGRPWFSILASINNHLDSENLISMAIDAYSSFHLASRSIPSNNRQITLSVDFSLYCARPEIEEILPDVKHSRTTATISSLLETSKKTMLHSQHGDFCINNLLFDESLARIIDLEHYCEIYTPLHDAIMLTDSLLRTLKFNHQPNVDDLWKRILHTPCSGIRTDKLQLLTDCLYVMYLMWWVCETAGNPRRQSKYLFYRKQLMHAYEHFSADSNDLLKDFFLRNTTDNPAYHP